jgi:uncharacterized protein (UPF0276 family)
MYEHAVKLGGNTATLLEWDDRIPSFEEVHMKRSKPTNSETTSLPVPKQINSREELLAMQRAMAEERKQKWSAASSFLSSSIRHSTAARPL